MKRTFLVEKIEQSGISARCVIGAGKDPVEALRAIELDFRDEQLALQADRRTKTLPINFPDRRRRYIVREVPKDTLTRHDECLEIRAEMV